MLHTEVLNRISRELRVPLKSVEATVALLEGGATVPFVARYRKEATGNLDEVKIRQVDDRRHYHQSLSDRKVAILANIDKLGKLTPDLKAQIEGCFAKSELEDLYLPYRPKKKTRAGVAVERGLEPLAAFIWDQFGLTPVETFALGFVNQERDVPDAAGAIDGALDIVAERLSEDARYRSHLREKMLAEGMVKAYPAEGKESEKTKYESYYKFAEAVMKIPSHRMLAVRRGAREKALGYKIEVTTESTIELMLRTAIRDPESQFAPLLTRAIHDACSRLILPAIETELKSFLRERSEAEAIQVFEENLRSLLMAPPAGTQAVLGVDPGQRTGSKLAAVDGTGRFLEHRTIFLTEPKKDLDAAEAALIELIRTHEIRGVAIGNGTGSRETEAFVREVLQKNGLAPFCIVVSEAGASVYSASKRAREEFGDLDITVRGAISIARRLQDPLAELVKIEPKSIGVGQYQHDVDQKQLRQSLGKTVESCVNAVGVELNTASADLLRYVSGIGEKLSLEIINHRNSKGPFRSRRQLREVTGFGDRTFEQAAGFLRVKDGDEPLDRTAVHPESYAVVEEIATAAGVAVAEMIGNEDRLRELPWSTLEERVGKFTLADIRGELARPARDPRKQFVVPQFRSDVREITDLQEGMELEGTVTNVTNFGAFVDLGVHQDGLVHISELSHSFVRDARNAVSVGDVVKVKVIGIDANLKRISLSMKAAMPKPAPRPRPAPSPKAAGETQRKPQREARAPRPPRPSRPSARPSTGEPGAADASPVTPKHPQGRRDRPPDRRPPAAPRAERKEHVGPPQSMEEKIRLLQAKFHGTK